MHSGRYRAEEIEAAAIDAAGQAEDEDAAAEEDAAEEGHEQGLATTSDDEVPGGM